MGIRKPAGAPVWVGEFGTVSVSCGLDCVMEAVNEQIKLLTSTRDYGEA
jgi:hypothetical protein